MHIQHALMWLLPGFLAYETYRAIAPRRPGATDCRLMAYVLIAVLADCVWGNGAWTYDRYYDRVEITDSERFWAAVASAPGLALLLGFLKRAGAWRVDTKEARVARKALRPSQGTEILVHLQGCSPVAGQVLLCESDHLVVLTAEHKTIAIPLERMLYWEFAGSW